jgi:hypothetical protein
MGQSSTKMGDFPLRKSCFKSSINYYKCRIFHCHVSWKRVKPIVPKVVQGKKRTPTPVCEAKEHGSRLPINQSIQNATILQSNNVVLSQTYWPQRLDSTVPILNSKPGPHSVNLLVETRTRHVSYAYHMF